jgi:hypothetical protein
VVDSASEPRPRAGPRGTNPPAGDRATSTRPSRASPGPETASRARAPIIPPRRRRRRPGGMEPGDRVAVHRRPVDRMRRRRVRPHLRGRRRTSGVAVRPPAAFAGITRFGEQPGSHGRAPSGPSGRTSPSASRLERDPFPRGLGRHGTTLLSGEESALVEAVRKDGWRIWLEPRAVVDHAVHGERCSSAYYWRRLWWAGVSRARAEEGRSATGLRLTVAAPVRLVLYAITRDRVYLYRSAETAGFLVEASRLRRLTT